MKMYLDHDISGLSIYAISNKAKYVKKINTLRSHLQSMDDHPLVILKDYFRELLENFIKKQSKLIEQRITFYKIDANSPSGHD